jgi:SAM-dependent methyltransferase
VKDYVKDYFDRNAHRWVEAAYMGDVKFPIGPERMRLAIEGVAPAMRDGGRLVDLGSGGGQLCIHAANLGWRALGVDVAPGMIDEARAAAEDRPIDWVVGEYDQSGAADGEADGVTAMGLIEYLDDDDALFAEAARLLGDEGRFAVSCRNRLYNLLSVNDYTASEDESARLLSELRETLAQTTSEDLYALADSLADAAETLREAAKGDRAEPPPDLHDHTRSFVRGRKQHTPRDVAAVGERHGFKHVETLALHPHPVPPELEPLARRTYNAIAQAWQRPLERSPAGLAFATAFVAVFERA